MWSKTKLVICSLALVFLAAASANAAIFMRIPGIDGESQDVDHRFWIDVLAFGGDFSAESCDNFHVTKELDKAFPKLVQSVVSGAVFPNIIVEYTATFGGLRETVSVITLSDASITRIGTDGSGNELAGRPTEFVSIRASSITIEYTEFDDLGNKGGTTIETVICAKPKEK